MSSFDLDDDLNDQEVADILGTDNSDNQRLYSPRHEYHPSVITQACVSLFLGPPMEMEPIKCIVPLKSDNDHDLFDLNSRTFGAVVKALEDLLGIALDSFQPRVMLSTSRSFDEHGRILVTVLSIEAQQYALNANQQIIEFINDLSNRLNRLELDKFITGWLEYLSTLDQGNAHRRQMHLNHLHHLLANHADLRIALDCLMHDIGLFNSEQETECWTAVVVFNFAINTLSNFLNVHLSEIYL